MRDAEVSAGPERRCRAWDLPLQDRLAVFKTCPWLAWPLVVLSTPALYWGWTVYYGAQFAATPEYLWPFVSDSPNAVLVFLASVAFYQLGRRWATLDLLAWVLNVKVGVWSVVILLYWYDEFFSHDATERWFLFVLHVGMVAWAFVHHRDLRRRPPWGVVAAVFGLTLLDLVLDYTVRVNDDFNVHPPLPGGPYGFVSDAGLIAVGITLGTLALAFWLYAPWRRAPDTAVLQR
jgi:uncharacterized membrane protein YpjA